MPDENDQNLNPGQSDYEQKTAFDPSGKSINENSDQNSTASDLKNAEENPSDEWDNKYTGQKEKLQADQKRKSTTGKALMRIGKKKGPLTAIILTLVGGGTIIGALLSPSLLIVQMKEALFDYLNDARPALNIRTNKNLYTKFKTAKNAFAESSNGKCNIKCKFGSMDDTMKRNLEAKGFKVEATKGTGLASNRWILDAVTFPATNGPEPRITNAAEWTRAMKDPVKAISFQRVFNSKTAYFLNSKFGSILGRLGLNKISALSQALKDRASDTTTSAKEKIKAAYRQALGLSATPVDVKGMTAEEKMNADPRYGKIQTSITNSKSLATGVGTANIVGGVCTSYNIAKSTTYATKITKMAAFTAFAMILLNAADENKASDSNSEVMTFIGDMFTRTDANGKSATDSLAYKMTNYGDVGNLTAEDQAYSSAPSTSTVQIVSGVAGGIATAVMLNVGLASKLCKISGNVVINILESCPGELAVATTAAGTVVGLPAAGGALVFCVAKVTITIAVISTALSAAISALIPAIIEGEIPKLDENTVGPGAFNAAYSGSAKILGTTAAAYGMRAGTKEDIQEYVMATAEIKKQQQDIARYEAQSEPLNIYNQYSFLGSIAKQLKLSSIKNSSATSAIGSILSIVPNTLSSLTSNASADASSKAAQYGRCEDAGLLSVNVEADIFCNPSYVMSASELAADPIEVVDAMLDYKTEIDEDGVAIPGSEYQLYLDNCANRTDPLGETSSSIEEENYAWKIGQKCSEDSDKMSNFRVYTMDYAINATMDGDVEPETTNASAYDGLTAQQLAKAILQNENVSDKTGQVAEIAAGTSNKVDVEVLKFILNLGQNNTFTISSLWRDYVPENGSQTSKHLVGKAVDISGSSPINGKDLSYDGFDNDIQDFINQASGLLINTCQIGVPNNFYESSTNSISNCNVFKDIGTGAHLHFAVEN